jgi:DNA-binding response OmpR family regulator
MNAPRVLVVDDEVDFADTLCKMLRRRGMEVTACRAADEALWVLQGAAYDVVLLDLKMPGLSGTDCLPTIRRIAPETPVILLTGHLAVEDERKALEAGAYAYLFKPHPFEDLFARITEAVQRRPHP